MSNGLKVRCTEKIYYIDGIRYPGLTNQAGDKLDEFYLAKKEDFNPNFMEPLGWEPENKKVDDIFMKEDGGRRTAPEVASIKSDQLDANIRNAKAAKVATEQKQFVELANKKAPGVL